MNESNTLTFHGGQSNYYVQGVERMAAFYREAFGFQETYRTPPAGTPEHIELRLGSYLIGLSSLEAGRRIHHLPGKFHVLLACCRLSFRSFVRQ